MGPEQGAEEQPLCFSELRKTLVSPRGHLVPHKVVEWLMGKSLAQLVTQSQERRDACEAVISCYRNDRIEWFATPTEGGQASQALQPHHLTLTPEDLVLAEERTSKKDRQRIMEGQSTVLHHVI